MRKSIFAAIVFGAVALQLTVVNHFKIFGIKPDLILISIVLVSLFCDLRFAVTLSIAAGALKDIYGSGPLAVNSILSGLWSFLIINLSRRVSLDIDLIRAALVFVIAVLNSFLMTAILWYLGASVAFGIFMRSTFLDSLYTSLVSLLAFKILKVKNEE
jgi:rod shape-determining protein MreD